MKLLAIHDPLDPTIVVHMRRYMHIKAADQTESLLTVGTCCALRLLLRRSLVFSVDAIGAK